jgi:hypothetical protein
MALKDDQISKLTRKWANHNKDAAAFLENVAAMTRLADDIADGDSKDPVADVAHLLHRAVITNGRNKFFQEHKDILSPVMATSIMMWAKSEQWRRSENRKTRMFAFVYREGVEHVAHVTALLTGGVAHALDVMEDIHRKSHQTSTETFEDWEKE